MHQVSDPQCVSPLRVLRLGEVLYEECVTLQKQIHEAVRLGLEPETLLLCSHPPVFTCGSSTDDSHLLTSEATLHTRGLRLVEANRGGSVTYHGPEQVIGYPVLNLNRHRRDVGWYMRSLEEVIIRSLARYGVHGVRQPGRTGVWITEHSKIAFIGVKISRWCTYHGFSVNISPCSEPFSLINPCGLGDVEIVALSELLHLPVDRSKYMEVVELEFRKVFEYE
jgi:lipoyl(octanoyl) transferase